MDVTTIQRHIADQQKLHPAARGDFSMLMTQIALAAKMVDARVRRAGLLVNVLGAAGGINVQGEKQQKLDLIANGIMKGIFHGIGYVGGMASEEEEGIIDVPEGMIAGRYIILFDPLDGSSNIDANVTIGTIFSIYRLNPEGKKATLRDFLQPGELQVGAGYVLYGSSTMLVYTTGDGVNGFTLEPTIGEFLLSHEKIRVPDRCKVFSANASNYPKWRQPTRDYSDFILSGAKKRYEATTSRYIGSLVADFHRNLLYGGVFLYPDDEKNPEGKLRLLYECNPLALLAQQAGGAATDGTRDILEIQPESLHQRCPFVVGTREEVELYRKFQAGEV